jgi:hypothetical protein
VTVEPGGGCTVHVHAFDTFKLTGVVTGTFLPINLLDFMSAEKRTMGPSPPPL